MKKIFRCTAVILAVVLIAFSLCSCRKLDSMRAHQAFYNNEDKTEILLEGNIYKAVNSGNREFLFTNTFDSYCVTTKDVPVLLSSYEGDYLNVNEERTVINCVYNYHQGMEWYVREDVYDKYRTALTDAKLDRYFIAYNEYPSSGTEEFRVRQRNVLLDEKTTEAVNKLLSMTDKDKVSYKELSDGDYAHKIIFLQKCDKDMLITDGSSGISIVNDGGKYYVCESTDNEYALCPATDDAKELLAKLFEDYPDSADTFNYKYSFEPDTSYGMYPGDDIYYDATERAASTENNNV